MTKVTRSSIQLAIEAALTFLINARDRRGWWIDFSLAAGFSDEWVTGYVGTTLASIPDPRCAEAAVKAWYLLDTRRRPSGAWGYNSLTPGDSDSTAWGIQLACAVGNGKSGRAIEAHHCLTKHVQANGGIATYAVDEPIRHFIGAPDELSFCGWCDTHTCVTAAAAVLPGFNTQVRAYLRRMQCDDGSWSSYWWCEPEYATDFAAAALAREGNEDDITRVRGAVQWALERLSPDGIVTNVDCPGGSPFATALCLRTLLLASNPESVHEQVRAATTWLLQHQLPNGSWPPSARLRIPLPCDKHPDLYHGWVYHGKIQGSIVVDQRAVFTTATVLKTLQMVSEAGGIA